VGAGGVRAEPGLAGTNGRLHDRLNSNLTPLLWRQRFADRAMSPPALCR
jgi:hypothetical protein